MNKIDFTEIDYESLFDEWLCYLKNNRATSFKVDTFKYWLRFERKYFKGYFKVSGSNHGQKAGNDEIEKLSLKILDVWEQIGIIASGHSRRRWVEAYDIVTH